MLTLWWSSDAEVVAARGRAHRKQGSRSSLSSELEAFSPIRLDSGALVEKISPPKSSGDILLHIPQLQNTVVSGSRLHGLLPPHNPADNCILNVLAGVRAVTS